MADYRNIDKDFLIQKLQEENEKLRKELIEKEKVIFWNPHSTVTECFIAKTPHEENHVFTFNLDLFKDRGFPGFKLDKGYYVPRVGEKVDVLVVGK